VTESNRSSAARKPSFALVWLAMPLIFAVALGLRVWGAFFDLPYIYHPDEPVNIKVIHAMVMDHDPNPHYFRYPSLVYDLDVAATWVYFGLPAILSDKQWAISDPLTLAMGTTYTSSPDAVVLYRSLTICAALLSIVLVYLIGRRGHSERAGVIAAALMAISPVVVAESRYVTPDSYVVLFELLTILMCLRIAQSGRMAHYLLAGGAVGATAASKYNGALICLTVVAAHALHFGPAPRHWEKLLMAGACSALVFLVFTPFALLDAQTFITDSMYEFGHYASHHQGMEGGGSTWYLRELWTGMGVAAVLAAGKAAGCLGGRSALCVVLVSFAVPYLLFISSFHVHNDRTMLPIVPCALLLAAMMFVDLASARSPLHGVAPGLRWAALAVLGVALLLIPVRHTIEQSIAITTIDSRTTAREWIDSTLPDNALIAIESYSPFVDPTRFRIVQSERAIDHTASWYEENSVDYVVLSEGMFGRYFGDPRTYAPEVSRYLQLMQAMTLVKRFNDGGYEVAVFQTSPGAANAP